MTKRRLGANERAEIEIVSDVVTSRHELHACGSPKRLHMELLEAHAVCREPVEMRGLVGLSAIRGHAFVAEITGHDEDDVRLVCCEGRMTDRE